MITLLSPKYVPEAVTQDDMIIASICWGFTLGFGFLTVWAAVKQTTVARRVGRSRLTSPYISMIWLEIAVCLAFSIICWLHLRGVIPPSFAFFFCILTFWALQVQFLLQIIINRILILLLNRRKGNKIRAGVAVLITAINITVYCIWIPARLQISQRYIRINNVWDRCEKAIYLCVDGALNIYFIRTVQKNLINNGLKKYESLVKFNIFLIFFSLSMDILIIAMMSLKNSFVYMQFHPLAYIVKLKIEMSMADLIATVSRIQIHEKANGNLKSDPFNNGLSFPQPNSNQLHPPKENRPNPLKDSVISLELRDIIGSHPSRESSLKAPKGHRRNDTQSSIDTQDMRVYTKKEVTVQFESKVDTPDSLRSSFDDTWPSRPAWALKKEVDIRPIRRGPVRSNDGGFGVSTKVWKG